MFMCSVQQRFKHVLMSCLTATSTRLPLLTTGAISSSQYATTRRETSFMHSVLGIAQTPLSSTTLPYLCGQRP